MFGAVLENATNEAVGQSIRTRKCAKVAISISDESTAFRANPESIVASNHQAEDVVVGKSRGVIAVEKRKASAIESQQASGGTDPEIAIISLGEGLDNLLGKPILHSPCAFGVGWPGTVS